MNKKSKFFASLIAIMGILLSVSCNSCQSAKTANSSTYSNEYKMVSPMFNADSAYSYIEKQLSFGPRVPGTQQHVECGNWLASKLKAFGTEVIEQKANVIHIEGQEIEIRNIIASHQPQKEKRVMLFAHWDSRPYADEESDREQQNKPIMGADDGASGVGVLLEIARQLQNNNTEIGIDIMLFDLEDWGQPNFETNCIPGDWWCVGSRYWSEQQHIENYKAEYGILLDMVGAANATFMHEGYSMQYASQLVSKIWSTAANLGYSQYFVQKNGGYITDDHVPIIENMNIPCVDIINLKNSSTGFASHWHTHNDDIRNISKETLRAAGQTVMEVIYKEK